MTAESFGGKWTECFSDDLHIVYGGKREGEIEVKNWFTVTHRSSDLT
jgi:hypothetical protein